MKNLGQSRTSNFQSEMEVDQNVLDEHEDLNQVINDKRKIYEIKPEYEDLVPAGVDAVLQKWKKRKGPVSNFLSGDMVHTTKADLKSITGLKFYCTLVGDYESLIFLGDDAPALCPSIHPNTICNFLRYKSHTNKDTQLIGINDEPIFDVLGNKVICDGKWNAVINEKQFGSTITKLHRFRKQNTKEYHDSCPDCFEYYERGQRIGCLDHHTPQPFRSGNPMFSMQVEKGMRNLKASQEIFDVNGASSLNPFQLEEIRAHLVGTRSLIDYQTWVIILIGIKLFLRINELTGDEIDIHGNIKTTGIRMEDFDQHNSGIEDGLVTDIAIRIKGNNV